jgi:hypothetical protein
MLGNEFVDLFVTSTVHDYALQAAKLATMSLMDAPYNIRRSICKQKQRLFGDSVIEDVTLEWKLFLQNIFTHYS